MDEPTRGCRGVAATSWRNRIVKIDRRNDHIDFVLAIAVLLSARAAAQTQLLSDTIHRPIPAGTPAFPIDTLAAAAGDLDGDGDRDLVLGARVLLNDGSGIFRAAACPAPVPVPQIVRAAALADFDNDGDLDAILGGNGADDLWINDGQGCFSSAAAQLPAPSGFDWSASVALGDVDGNGFCDIVLANNGDDIDNTGAPGQVRLWLNTGGAMFTDATAMVAQAIDDDPRAVALGNVDNDTDLDLFVAASTDFGHAARHRLLLNDGSGTFANTTGQIPLDATFWWPSVALVDLDGDSDDDVLIGDGTFYENDGSGHFSDTSNQLPPMSPLSMWAAIDDVDGDQDLDIVSIGDERRLLLNNGTGVFADAPRSFQNSTWNFYERVRAWLSDVDGDGDPDALIGNGETVELWLDDGAARFTEIAPLLPASGLRTSSFAIGDVDGDLDLDVLAGVEGQDQLFLNRGNGEFADGTSRLPTDSDTTWSVALVDVDSDGDLDALFGNGGSTSPTRERLYLNDGAGTFTSASAQWPTPLDRTYAIATADADNDGDVDVLTCNDFTPNRLYFNDSHGNFAEVPGKWPSALFPALDAVFFDQDGDGDQDALLSADGTAFFVNDGSGGFTALLGVPFGPNGSSTMALTLADFDGDGDDDVLTGSTEGGTPSNTVRLFRNNGATGSFTEVASPASLVFDSVTDLAQGDLDGDGDRDLLIGTYPRLRFFAGNSSGGFSDASALIPPFPTDLTSDLTLGDLDFDGDLDVLLGMPFSKARMLPNLTRHVARRSVPRPGQALVFDLWGQPSKPWTLFGSTGRTFLPLGMAGFLQIVRDRIFFQTGGTFDAQGRATATWNVPNDPTLVGTSRYWQTLHKNPRRLSNLEITTILDL